MEKFRTGKSKCKSGTTQAVKVTAKVGNLAESVIQVELRWVGLTAKVGDLTESISQVELCLSVLTSPYLGLKLEIHLPQ